MDGKTKLAATLLIITQFIGFIVSLPAYASDDAELVGDILTLAIPATTGGMALYKNDKEGEVQLCKSILTTLGATYTLKYSINERRPNGDSYSFPSGHTSVAFSSAAFLQKRYGWQYGIPAYMAASVVGWSRIESDNHYFKDVLAGAAVGVISTYIFTDAYQGAIAVTPVVGKGTYGMLVNTTF